MTILSDIAAITGSVAWPIVIAGGLYAYKDPLTDFARRIAKAKIGATGAELETLPPPDQVKAEKQAEISEVSVKEAVVGGGGGRPPPLPLLAEIETSTLETVERSHPDNKDAQIAWLNRFYAHTLMEKFHETNFRLIFGSQLLALYRLNAQGGTAPAGLLKPLYSDAVANFPEIHRGRSFDEWINFLQVVKMVERKAGPGEDLFSITLKGVAFMQYIIENKLPEKPY